MADVARVAGVSAQTVSRVSTGYAGVSPTTRRRVFAVMTALGYRPNDAARALKRGEFRTLGVACLSPAGDSRLLDAIITHATASGFAITLFPGTIPDEGPGRHGFASHGFTRLDELAVDGVIVLAEAHQIQLALPPSVPQVIVGGGCEPTESHTSVGVDQVEGVRRAVHHLLGLGHRTVWHVSGPERSPSARCRAGVWRAALNAAGRPVPPPLHGDWTARSGYSAGVALAGDPRCSAVLAANDRMALGVLSALQRHGRAVPAQVSVVGFDDVAESASFPPPLTTVSQDFAEVARLGVRELLRRVRGETEGPERILVPARLIVRSSTATAAR